VAGRCKVVIVSGEGGQRIAVILKVYQEMSREDIAQAFKCTIISVDSLVHRTGQTPCTFSEKKPRVFLT
jgi:hypothetical protein